MEENISVEQDNNGIWIYDTSKETGKKIIGRLHWLDLQIICAMKDAEHKAIKDYFDRKEVSK